MNWQLYESEILIYGPKVLGWPILTHKRQPGVIKFQWPIAFRNWMSRPA